MDRLVVAYENRDIGAYGALFTGDFDFGVATETDPDATGPLGVAWTKADEMLSATHLFEGGVTASGDTVSAAKYIELSLSFSAPRADTGAGRDPSAYAVIDAGVYFLADLGPNGCSSLRSPPIQAHRFWFVRGDVARGLDPEQPADADHWYIWSWYDISALLGKAAGTQTCVWTTVKEAYR